jgi:ribosome-binding factor A
MSRVHQKGGEPSQRMLRVAELIRHAVAQLLARGEINDPDLAGLVVTVPSVKMSPDLKLATIYVLPMGGQGRDSIVAVLDRHKKFLRGEIAHQVNLKYAPDIRFRIDESFDNAERIDALLHSPKVAQDLAAPRDEEGGE